MRFCRIVRLLCREAPPLYSYYISVNTGGSYLGCRVGYCYPNPCTVSPSTVFSFEEDVRYEVKELEKNILVRLFFSRGGRDVYIYPKHIWEKINSRFIEPLSKGHPPREAGAILYGPPGTGKTSMARILAWIQGLYRVDVSPETILSKYVGESEQKLSSTLSTAEQYEPSLVLFDDAEWLTRSRESISGGEDTGVFLGLVNILLRKIEEWKRNRHMIVSIITTNVSEDRLDPALRRSGRLGRPIFIPLPDFEAVYNLLLELGVEPGQAEKYSVKIVNAGLPMSDAVSIAHELLDGVEPRIEPIRGRGYVRMVPPSLDRDVEEFLRQRKYSSICHALRKGTRIWVPAEPSVGIPLISSLIGIVCKKPIVILSDQRRFDEAVTTSDTNNAVLIVEHDYMARDIVNMIYTKALSPIVFIGTSRPNVHALPLRIKFSIHERIPVLKLMAKFYDIPLSEEDLRTAKSMKDKDFETILLAMGVYRAPLKYIREKILPVA